MEDETMVHGKIRGASWLAVGGLALGVLGTTPAEAILIDGFDAPQTQVANSAFPTEGGVTLDAGILGGESDWIAQYTSGPGSIVLTVDAGGNGLLEAQADAGTLGGVAAFWDGVDGTPFGAVGLGLGVDLTAGGADALAVTVVSNATEVLLGFNLFGTLGGISQGVIVVPGGIVSPTVLTLAFASLTAGADLTDIGGIEMDVNPGTLVSAGPNIAIDLVETVAVPEPAALLLLLPGTAAALRRRSA